MLRTTLLISVCLVLFGLPAGAQDGSEWSIWIWNNTTQEFIRVYYDGSRLIIPLRLPNGYVGDYHPWYLPSFTTDGRYMAICAAAGTDSTVFVYDMFDGSQVSHFPFTYAQACHAVFDETSTRLAIGLAWFRNPRWRPMDVEARMIVLELATGRVLAELYPGTRHPDTSEWFPFIGYPVVFDGNTVYFDEVPYEGRTDVWEWNIREGTFVELINYPRPASNLQSRHLLATGERIELMLNPNLEFDVFYGLGGGPQPNIIDLVGNDGTRTPILYSPMSDIQAISFIDNGRKIALLVSPNFEVAAWTHYLDRNGNLVTLLPEMQNNGVSEELYGTGDGFVLLSETEDGHDELIHFRFEGDDLIRSVLWQAEAADETWDVVWVTQLEGEPGLRPLTELEMITFEGAE